MCVTAETWYNHLSCDFVEIKGVAARTANESLAVDAKGEFCKAVGTGVCDVRRVSGVETYTEIPGSAEGFPLLLLSCLWTASG